MNKKKQPHSRYDPVRGLVYETVGHSTHISWSKTMLDMLVRDFPTTTNEELSGCLGVSQRTMLRKARELGLVKNKEWLINVYRKNIFLAHIIAKSKGNPGAFKKGNHYCLEHEFKTKKVQY